MGNELNLSSCTNCFSKSIKKSDIVVEDNNLFKLESKFKNKHIRSKLIKLQAAVRNYLFKKSFNYTLKIENGSKPFFPSENKNLKYVVAKCSNKITETRFNQFCNQLPTNTYENKEKVELKILEYENDSIYYGEVNDKMIKHNKGILLWRNGSCYQGYWFNDKPHGYGILCHFNGDIYEGNWINGKANGNGIYKYNDGSRYEGSWKEDKQHGRGTEIFNDGAIYDGNFENGFKSGYGVFTWSNGCKYFGMFLNNNINGKGEYFWNDKKYYCGDWVNNKMHGEGEFTWSDGKKYKGSYKNDKKNGYGEFEWSDSRKFKGMWLNGKQHGDGEEYFPKENIWKKGKWCEGKRIQWLN